MSRKVPNRHKGQRDSGYAIVIVMFFLALLVLAMSKAAPTIISQVQREKEADMIWKGEQYARGVKLYYMKTHRFPPSMEDLTTNKTGIRFMRQAYKDPMNKGDGSWRLIYVGPSGQLIGSLKNRSISFNGQGSAPPNAAGTQSQSSFGNSSFGSSFGSGFGNNSAATNNNPGSNAAANSGQSGTTDTTNGSGDAGLGQPQSIGQPMGMMDSSSVIGGNIIGVGSKVDKKSFMWYDKAKNYREFEFIWDPSKDLRVGGASRGIGTPVQNLNNPNSPVSGPMQTPNSNGGLNSNPSPPLQAPPSN